MGGPGSGRLKRRLGVPPPHGLPTRPAARVRFMETVDQRSRVARTVQRRFDEAVAHLGGDPTVAEVSLAKQFARFDVATDEYWSRLLPQLQAGQVSPQLVNLAAGASDAAARLAKELGYQPQRKREPTLTEYLAARAAEQAAAARSTPALPEAAGRTIEAPRPAHEVSAQVLTHDPEADR